MLHVFGIPNCDSVKKATHWLKNTGLEFTFHDVKKEGISIAQLQQWSQQIDWTLLLNKKSTTWQGLQGTDQATANEPIAAFALINMHPTLLKRPVIVWPNSSVTVGFSLPTFETHTGAIL